MTETEKLLETAIHLKKKKKRNREMVEIIVCLP